METLHGPVNIEGLFTPINPNGISDTPNCVEFENKHPQLLCYNQHNQLVIGLNYVEVTGPVWRYWNGEYKRMVAIPDGVKIIYNNSFTEFSKSAVKTDQIYLTVPPTDTHPLDGDREEESDNEYMDAIIEFRKNHPEVDTAANYGPGNDNYGRDKGLADAQPVKEVEKTDCLACGGEFDNKLQAQLGICGKCLRGVKLDAIAKTDSGWLEKAKARCVSKELKTAEEMLKEAHKDHPDCYFPFTRTVSLHEVTILKLMKAFHSQFATEAGGDVEEAIKDNSVIEIVEGLRKAIKLAMPLVSDPHVKNELIMALDYKI